MWNLRYYWENDLFDDANGLSDWGQKVALYPGPGGGWEDVWCFSGSASKHSMHCSRSVIWLGQRLELPRWFDLKSMVVHANQNGTASWYKRSYMQQSKTGKVRILHQPIHPPLVLLQSRLKNLITSSFYWNENTFGFVGGRERGPQAVAGRHARYGSTYKFDLCDAFFQPTMVDIYASLRKRVLEDGTGEGFSVSVAEILTKLCMYYPGVDANQSFLPQGACTSPVLFHRWCLPLDKMLAGLAKRWKGIYSRYADNCYLTIPLPHFPKKYIKIIERKRAGLGVKTHKRQIAHHDQMHSMSVLGYQISKEQLNDAKVRRIRFDGLLHALQKAVASGDVESLVLWDRARGLYQVMVKDRIPKSLHVLYEACQESMENFEI